MHSENTDIPVRSVINRMLSMQALKVVIGLLTVLLHNTMF